MSHPHPRLTRRVVAIGSAAAITVGLGACASEAAPSGAAVTTISVADYYTDEPAKSIIGDALDACAVAADVTIERESIPSADLVSKTLQKVSSKTLPDIQMLDNPDLPAIASTGALQPLADAGVATDNFGKSALGAGSFDGDVFGVAPTLGTIVMFYNVDLLAAAGITEPPATWSELRDDAAALTSGDTYGLAFSAKASAEATYAYLPLLWSGGGAEDDLTAPEAEAALELEVDLVTNGSASESVVQWGNSDVGDQFAAGKAALAFTSASQMAKFDDMATVNYKIATIPVPEEGDTSVAPLGGEVWTLPLTGDTARQDKAAEVLTCLVSDETQLSLAVQRGAVPANPDLDTEYLAQLPELGAYVDQVREGRARTTLLGTEWADVSTKIYTAVQSAITGQSSVSDALKTASE